MVGLEAQRALQVLQGFFQPLQRACPDGLCLEARLCRVGHAYRPELGGVQVLVVLADGEVLADVGIRGVEGSGVADGGLDLGWILNRNLITSHRANGIVP